MYSDFIRLGGVNYTVNCKVMHIIVNACLGIMQLLTLAVSDATDFTVSLSGGHKGTWMKIYEHLKMHDSI